MKLTKILALSLLGSAVASLANATAIAPLNGFTAFASMDNKIIQSPGTSYECVGTVGSGCYNQPQAFDAEYLGYKREGNILYVALQTGFDLVDGHMKSSDGRDIYAGDLAISIAKASSGESIAAPLSNYGFAVDFGLETRNWKASPKGVNANSYEVASQRKWAESAVEMDNNGDAKDVAGVYSVTKWDNYTSFSSPFFGATEGTKLTDLLQNKVFKEGESFARIVAFDLAAFGIKENEAFVLNAFWTMSCGNDNIWGEANVDATSEVPVPAAAWLFGSALLGLAGVKRKA